MPKKCLFKVGFFPEKRPSQQTSLKRFDQVVREYKKKKKKKSAAVPDVVGDIFSVSSTRVNDKKMRYCSFFVRSDHNYAVWLLRSFRLAIYNQSLL